MSRSTTSGRRATRTTGWRLGGAAALTALVPLVTLGASLLVQQHPVARMVHAPTTAGLDALRRGCPPAPDREDLVVTNAVGTSGTVTVRPVSTTTGTKLELGEDAVAVRPASEPTAIGGDGRVAVGLLASLIDERTLATVPCPTPVPETWFAGVGARYGHGSVLQVINTDPGPAVVDVTVYAKSGILDVPEVQGVQVPGDSVRELDLAQIVPRHRDLALRVVVSRGRAGVTLRDTVRDPARRTESADWLVGQQPAESRLLLGLPFAGARRTLALANPGPDEVQVTLKVVTDQATFAPVGLDQVRVGPFSSASVPLSRVIGKDSEKDAQGLLVSSSDPVVAAVRGIADQDLVLTSASPEFSSVAAAIVPDAKSRLVLSAYDGTAQATVVTRAADGRQLGEVPVRVSSTRSVSVRLPPGAVVVRVTTDHPIAGAVWSTRDRRATVVPLSDYPTVQLIPHVTPAGP